MVSSSEDRYHREIVQGMVETSVYQVIKIPSYKWPSIVMII